jgi:acylphosphatase
MIKHYSIIVSGKVQGVGFRLSTLKQASIFGIKGYVKNNYCDGSVIIEAQGEEANLEDFILWCRKGPSMAGVEHVTVKEISLKVYSEFEIR